MSLFDDQACIGTSAARDMQSVVDLIPVTPSIDQLGRIIASVAAPAFLLGAVAAFISVLISRINRVIDRSQFIHGIPESDASRSFLKADLPRLRQRAVFLNRSLYCAVIAAILTALIVIIAFVSALLHFAHEYGVAILFMAAMVMFCASLIDLARETRIALHDNDLRI
ncbi:DUF2721 domain-containing protein [Bradyrhizobium sp. CCGUVB1N3]|uniref:DUF2721 domain-containing protein n=1 Tax=Bradyrhizobium sp. CCGUVB1N3 TaxID=2949629 RepID=UPI0020B19FE3|nr:DUF2721 domain-containing protein [Bradyrhizobium sp. CCGUVB1N3]MCP3470251.1 DUF2721 domain-containing protein [Bradyrhizobium sp. CCGUVB1N3]